MRAFWIRQAFVRQVAAIAILVVMSSTAWLILLKPILDLALGQDDQFDKLNTRVALLRDEIQGSEILRPKLEQANHKLQNSPVLWKQATASEISAEVQARLKEVVSTAGGATLETAELPVTLQKGFRRVQVRADLVESLPALYETLRDLEGKSPFLIIDELNLQSLSGSSFAEEPRLSVALVVSAYQDVDR